LLSFPKYIFFLLPKISFPFSKVLGLNTALFFRVFRQLKRVTEVLIWVTEQYGAHRMNNNVLIVALYVWFKKRNASFDKLRMTNAQKAVPSLP
jgi:hypothetical protein